MFQTWHLESQCCRLIVSTLMLCQNECCMPGFSLQKEGTAGPCVGDDENPEPKSGQEEVR